MARRVLTRLLVRVVAPVAVLLVVLSAIGAVETYRTPSPSMEPGMSRGDRFLVWTIGYEPEVGDVAIFRVPGERTLLVKRVVAGPGDRIRMQDGRLIRNGRPESGFAMRKCSGTYVENCDFPTETVPARHYFVLGDNRDVTGDSRDWGPVPGDRFEGRKLLTYWKG